MAELKFLTDGESIFVLTADKKVVLDTLKKQFVFSFALDKIFEELNGELKDFSEERKYTVNVKRQKYEVILHPAAEGGYWVECPFFPGCASQGDSVEEALSMIKDAIRGHLEVLKEDEKLKGTQEKYHSSRGEIGNLGSAEQELDRKIKTISDDFSENLDKI
jgi:Uncharacterized conserved protein